LSRTARAVNDAYESIDWRIVDGRLQLTERDLRRALEQVYRVGHVHGYATGYTACRSDCAQAIGQLLGEHELFLEETE
jgi:hypothetical protein